MSRKPTLSETFQANAAGEPSSDAAASVSAEPIALIGIGCRLPGADDPRRLWEILSQGLDMVGEFPEDRWNMEAVFDEQAGTAGKMYTRRGGFLQDVDGFDATFFGISPREVEHMDPQQRLLLEVAWEALEDAGLPATKVAGSRTGVFLGMWTNEFDAMLGLQPRELDLYALTGGGKFGASGRVSHFLGLCGPSFTVDTACSSSLTAFHLACQSIRNGESEMALACGSNLLLDPRNSVALSRGEMLSPDARCKFGSAEADGFGRSDGVAVAVLKPLSKAMADGDPVYAVVRGSALNNNGRSAGQMVVPGREAQAEAVRQACGMAGFPPADLDYVEAHGTGTLVGDPIELGALGSVLGEGGRPDDRPCYVGSVKTNIGHTEGAAGVSGVIKTALALKHGVIPASLHAEELSPRIPWDELPVEIPRRSIPFPATGRPARAGVSATGLSGTNAHVVLEAPPEAVVVREAGGEGHGSSRSQYLLPLSAANGEARRQLAGLYAQRLRDLGGGETDEGLADVVATAALRRTHLPFRLGVVGGDAESLAVELEAFAAGDAFTGAAGVASEEAPKAVFVFPGQGCQWWGMGRQLMVEEPAFRAALERCDEAVRRETGWSVIEELERPEAESQLATADGDMDVVQPVLFAVQVSLAALWRSWGIEPAAVVGHSMGEVAAACVAGALSLEDGVRVICRRSRLLRRIAGEGSMLLVELSYADSESRISAISDRVSIAVSNGPTSTVLAGETAALESLAAELDDEEIFHRWVKVAVAAHSPGIDPLVPELLELLQEVEPRVPDVPFFSTVDVEYVEGAELDADYWARNLRQPVRFGQALDQVVEAGHGVLLEVSPHPLLVGAMKEALERAADGGGVAEGSLRRDSDEAKEMRTGLAALHAAGCEVRWEALHPGGHRVVPLPRYPWQHTRFPFRRGGFLAGEGPLLGRAAGGGLLGPARLSADRPDRRVWALDLDLERHPDLADHRVQDSVLLPATAFLTLALEAAAQVYGEEAPLRLTDVELHKALVLDAGEVPEAQLVLTANPDRRFRVYSRSEAAGDWQLHAEGRITEAAAPVEAWDPSAVEEERGAPAGREEIYAGLAARGYQYGPRFQGVEAGWVGDGESVVRLTPARDLELTPCGGPLEPALLDAALQSILALAGDDTVVPVRAASVRCLRTPAADAAVWARARRGDATRRGLSDTVLTGDVLVVDEAGRPVAEVLGLELVSVAGSATSDPAAEWLYGVEWRRRDREAEAGEAGRWLLLSGAAGEPLGHHLEAAGGSVVRVEEGAPGEGLVRLAADHFRVDPLQPEAFRLLLDEVTGGGQRPLQGVAHLWNLDADSGEGDGAAELPAVVRRGTTGVVHLVQALAGLDPLPRLALVTAGAQAVADGEAPRLSGSPFLGLGRVLANEHPDLQGRRVDLSNPPVDEDMAALAEELLSPLEGDEIALRGGVRWEPNLVRHSAVEAEAGASAGSRPTPPAFRLDLPEVGMLDSMRLVSTLRRPPGPSEVEVEVKAGGLNFRHVLTALGEIPPSDGQGRVNLGLEAAGRVTAVGEGVSRYRVGDEVLAVGRDAFASHLLTTEDRLVAKPADLGWEEAAALPIVYATAYYSLVDLGRLGAGERVLIHSAAGGVGLAAVQIAQTLGAEVYATAGTEEKRDYLRGLGIEHVFDSRTLAFADQLLEATGGEGVEVVLNSLAGEAIPLGLQCLADYGRFLELGKVDFLADRELGLSPFLRNLSFASVDLNHMIWNRPDRFRRLLADTLAFFTDNGLDGLPVKTYPVHEAEKAFRFMMQGRHIGKLILRVDGSDPKLPADQSAPAALRDDRTYLVTGGLGGLGLEMARWMVERGVRHLALAGRSAPKAEAVAALERLRGSGAEIHVLSCDVSERASLDRALAGLRSSAPPLGGVFHCAMVLEDGILQQLDAEKVARVLAPKVDGAWNLHEATAEDPLDLFVLFSSAASLVGSPGQGNYAAANAFLDALAWHRRALGLPGQSLNWGPWAEVGRAARPDRGGRLAERGLGSLPPAVGLELFGRLLDDPVPQAGVMPVDWSRWAEFYAAANDSSLFAHMLATEGESAAAGAARPAGVLSEVLEAEPEERQALLEDFVAEAVGQVMGFAAARVEADLPLLRLGLDSLMAVELRNRIDRNLGVAVSVTRLLQGITARGLAGELLEKLEARHLLDSIDDMADDAVDALLEEMLAGAEVS